MRVLSFGLKKRCSIGSCRYNIPLSIRSVPVSPGVSYIWYVTRSICISRYLLNNIPAKLDTNETIRIYVPLKACYNCYRR